MNGKQVVRFNVKLLPQHSHGDAEQSNTKVRTCWYFQRLYQGVLRLDKSFWLRDYWLLKKGSGPWS